MSKTQIPTGGIADDAISEEHLDATAITGTTALAEQPATTDEILISDEGTLKRLDAVHKFNQPFAQKELKQKEAIENYIHEKEKIQEDLSRYQVPQVFHKPTKEIIYKQPRERIVKKMVPKEMTGLFVEQRVRKHEEKMEKPREMPRQVIRRVNMEGPLAQTKYRMPLEGVQDLQDMGAVKEDEKGQYVVNENPESVRDTLRFPQGTKHYSGKPYKKGQLIDESDYEDIIKKVNKS